MSFCWLLILFGFMDLKAVSSCMPYRMAHRHTISQIFFWIFWLEEQISSLFSGSYLILFSCSPMNPFIFLYIHLWLRLDPDTKSVDTQGSPWSFPMLAFETVEGQSGGRLVREMPNPGPSLHTLLVTGAPSGGLFLPPSPQQSQQVAMQPGFLSFHFCSFYCISHNALHHHRHPLATWWT